MYNLTLIRTGSENADFKELVVLLDTSLAKTDGDQHDFCHQYNGIDSIKYVVSAYQGNLAVGCGAIKKYEDKTLEIKRMYVRSDYRGQNIAGQLLAELEKWAKELGFDTCILETGKRQYSAIALYPKHGYQIIENYGQYVGVENSVCMNKKV
ncbi:MAG: GNAT family N-acetyltransferase [Cytophagia bacterium]|nr:MAG: GNAT family N-acetyltransferase [Runella sp.]TAG24353.1 MAG: GNAT family N-acetyltransferase [Cytophagales bacterium]TAG35190.1 MAG: GNAT family N-acetyltransferase [Cytophagia bacterium]TAG51336.1 MAG: GNAT family N-acetyltransferase [Runella slithyformis]TAG77122.1 MAG: GNAT family N-acetyltransferase [Cytophagales bacterium]